MLEGIQGILQSHPEIAFFLVLGLGYLFGKIALGSFKLGAVTGTLLAGVLVGQLGVTLPNEVKQCFFLLFLFAIGFRTGPQFFRGLKSDGLAHAALAAIVATRACWSPGSWPCSLATMRARGLVSSQGRSRNRRPSARPWTPSRASTSPRPSGRRSATTSRSRSP